MSGHTSLMGVFKTVCAFCVIVPILGGIEMNDCQNDIGTITFLHDKVYVEISVPYCNRPFTIRLPVLLHVAI